MTKLVLLFALVAGCAKTNSEDLLTHGIYASISAQATGNGSTQVAATLYVGSPTTLNFVDLTGDDQLIVSHGSDARTMTETTLGNLVAHTATFSTDADGDEFDVDFQRTVDHGAPHSVVILPPKFSLVPPPASISRASAFTLTWSPATPDRMTWSATGDCITPASGAIGTDQASVTLAAGTFIKRDGQSVPDTCAIKLDVNRQREGTVDPGYGKGGDAAGIQTRQITFTSAP